MWDKMVSRSEKRLSAKAVAAFRDAGRYADGGGLYLIVGENQRKRWVLRIQVDGRRRDFGLGSLGKVSLADAREKATKLRTQYVNGLDPAIERMLLDE
ncbi:MAG: Arm DNA-binding domain-containing protein [Pseudomonadota bacterium]|nr:Arm DNA-binding domain-containing protein [Pseudomonadota bacterium]